MLNNYLFPSLIRMTWLHHLVYISVMLQSSNGIFHLLAYTLRLIAQMYVKGWSLVIPIALTFQHKYCITIVYTVENMELLHELVHDKSPSIVKNCEQDITPFISLLCFRWNSQFYQRLCSNRKTVITCCFNFVWTTVFFWIFRAWK